MLFEHFQDLNNDFKYACAPYQHIVFSLCVVCKEQKCIELVCSEIHINVKVLSSTEYISAHLQVTLNKEEIITNNIPCTLFSKV